MLCAVPSGYGAIHSRLSCFSLVALYTVLGIPAARTIRSSRWYTPKRTWVVHFGRRLTSDPVWNPTTTVTASGAAAGRAVLMRTRASTGLTLTAARACSRIGSRFPEGAMQGQRRSRYGAPCLCRKVVVDDRPAWQLDAFTLDTTLPSGSTRGSATHGHGLLCLCAAFGQRVGPFANRWWLVSEVVLQYPCPASFRRGLSQGWWNGC